MDAFPNLDNTVIKTKMNDVQNTVTCTVSIFGTQEKEFAGIPTKATALKAIMCLYSALMKPKR